MSDYTQLHENVDNWYDYLNDAHAHIESEIPGVSHYPRFAQYFYTYLTCIDEFSPYE